MRTFNCEGFGLTQAQTLPTAQLNAHRKFNEPRSEGLDLSTALVDQAVGRRRICGSCYRVRGGLACLIGVSSRGWRFLR